MLRKKVFRKNGNLINYIFNTAQHVVCYVRDGWSAEEISSGLFGVKFQWNFSPSIDEAVKCNQCEFHSRRCHYKSWISSALRF